ncbi:MAG: SDR family oxidoreductase [Alphaproteobacteria bacterium]|nr:SDR family oxidoreductase [Alphaproteobacteria bacterium]
MTGVMLVTGGSRGIGAATARLAAERGWDVAIAYRRDGPAALGVAEAVRAAGRRALAVQADMAQEADIVRMFAAVDAEFGRIDAVVANAGTSGGRRRHLEAAVAADINALLAVNVTGVILCAREAIRRMSTRHGGKGGSIVVVGSLAARVGAPGLWVDYAASKGALDAFTIGAAQELAGEGIRVNCVRPGLIDTEIHVAAGLPDRVEKAKTQIPMRRAGDAVEVADAILWLASPGASYVAGAIVDVGGGR